jgi:hypothetical protein
MKKIKIYIDTSVIGGCFDKEFEQYSNRLFDNLKEGYPVLDIRTPMEVIGDAE